MIESLSALNQYRICKYCRYFRAHPIQCSISLSVNTDKKWCPGFDFRSRTMLFKKNHRNIYTIGVLI